MNRLEKSTRPSSLPSGGINTSSTKDATIFPKAAPIMIPTAMSSTFPRMANSLNSFSMMPPYVVWRGLNDRLCVMAEAERAVRAQIIAEARGNAGWESGGGQSARPEDQRRSDNSAHHHQNASRGQQRREPQKGHTRNRQNDYAKERQRKPARPVLPARPPFVRAVKRAKPPGDKGPAQDEPGHLLALN